MATYIHLPKKSGIYQIVNDISKSRLSKYLVGTQTNKTNLKYL